VVAVVSLFQLVVVLAGVVVEDVVVVVVVVVVVISVVSVVLEPAIVVVNAVDNPVVVGDTVEMLVVVNDSIKAVVSWVVVSGIEPDETFITELANVSSPELAETVVSASFIGDGCVVSASNIGLASDCE